MKRTVFLFIVFVLMPSVVFSADRIEMTLGEAVELSLENNLSYAKDKYLPKISEAGIKIAAGEFDPQFKIQLGDSYRKELYTSIIGPQGIIGTSGIFESYQRLFEVDTSVSGKVNTGTAYEIKWSDQRVKSRASLDVLNPYHYTETSLTLSQPLLKGFGKGIQESNLNVAKNSFEISRLALDDSASSVILDTANAYWELVSAIDEVEVAELSLNLAKNINEETKARIDVGVLAPVEIYKVEAEVAVREESLLKVRKIVSDSHDRLRITMGMKDWDTAIIPIEKRPSPSDMPALDECIKDAFNLRRDYKQANIDIKNREIMSRYYKNQGLPDFSLTGTAGRSGKGGRFSEANDRLDDGRYYFWELGVMLSIPIGNNTAKGNYLKARYEEEQAGLNLRLIEQKIQLEVREVWRTVQLNMESITATNKTRIAAGKRLEAEEGRFKVGMATLNDVLKFQEEYTKALSSEKRAYINYAKSVVFLEKIKGTLWQNGKTIKGLIIE